MAGRVIHKYVLPTTQDRFVLMMPSDWIFLSLQLQRGEPVIWANVWPESTVIERSFEWVATGQEPPVSAQYLGTVQWESLLQELVLHLYGAVPWPAP